MFAIRIFPTPGQRTDAIYVERVSINLLTHNTTYEFMMYEWLNYWTLPSDTVSTRLNNNRVTVTASKLKLFFTASSVVQAYPDLYRLSVCCTPGYKLHSWQWHYVSRTAAIPQFVGDTEKIGSSCTT